MTEPPARTTGPRGQPLNLELRNHRSRNRWRRHRAGLALADLLRRYGTTEVDVVGLALSHCVCATALDAQRKASPPPSLPTSPAPVSAETEEAALQALAEAGVAVTRSPYWTFACYTASRFGTQPRVREAARRLGEGIAKPGTARRLWGQQLRPLMGYRRRRTQPGRLRLGVIRTTSMGMVSTTRSLAWRWWTCPPASRMAQVTVVRGASRRGGHAGGIL
ncbi:MAG: hypothetical protein U1U88_001505 [Lawsonella clevelandensis]